MIVPFAVYVIEPVSGIPANAIATWLPLNVYMGWSSVVYKPGVTLVILTLVGKVSTKPGFSFVVDTLSV